MVVLAHRQHFPYQADDIKRFTARTASELGLQYYDTYQKKEVPYTPHTNMTVWYKVCTSSHGRFTRIRTERALLAVKV